MANVRDPAFWRRFSLAVHLDEEQNSSPDNKSASSNGSQPAVKHTDSWLERTRKKQRRSRCIGWLIVLFTILVIVAIVLVVLWVLKTGLFHNANSGKNQSA